MKVYRVIFCLSLMICLTAIAQEDQSGTKNFGAEGRPHGPGPMNGEIPADIKSQLNETQITKLEAATTREAKMALLKQWNIKMPEHPGGPRGPGPGAGSGGGPGKDKDKAASAATVTETVDQLAAQYKAATTDAEKEAVRAKLHALFYQSKSDEVKDQVRSFLKANRPAVSWQAPQRESSSSQSSTTQ